MLCRPLPMRFGILDLSQRPAAMNLPQTRGLSMPFDNSATIDGTINLGRRGAAVLLLRCVCRWNAQAKRTCGSSRYGNRAYSAFACTRIGMSESASFQSVRKSW